MLKLEKLSAKARASLRCLQSPHDFRSRITEGPNPAKNIFEKLFLGMKSDV